MKAFVRTACAIWLALQPIPSQAQTKVDLSINLNVVDFIRELATWVKDYSAHSRASESEKIKNSRVSLVKQLIDLSSTKKVLADKFTEFATTPDKYGKSYYITRLQSELREINRKMMNIQETMTSIDPSWVATHQDLYANFKVTMLQKDAIIIDNIVLLNSGTKSEDIAIKLGEIFRNEATKLTDIARQLEG